VKKKLFSEFNESLKIALSSLAANKMRATLTMLGIIIGVAAVIAMVGIGSGAQKAIADRIQAMGSNLLFVQPGSSRQGHIHFGSGSMITLMPEDVDALKANSRYIAAVLPEFNRRAQAQFGNKNWNTSIVGTVPEYCDVRNVRVTDGRMITRDEVDNTERVAVIGTEVRTNLFGSASPLNETIRIAQDNFVVVGVFEKKGQQGWQNQDDQIVIPYTTAQRRVFGADNLTGITVKVLDQAYVQEALVEVEKILRRQHRLNRDQDNDFSIRNQSDIISTMQETNETFNFLLAAIAGVSLLVGGIGIMNIMLVSVTERTREIGIRKAIGARRRDIMMQFLVESIVLSLAGGTIGIVVGVLASFLLATLANWNTLISPGSILLSFGFSTAVGLFFGLYPARKASLLDPITALRYE